jgi:2-alkyl-3-oxoalkanoate reductase
VRVFVAGGSGAVGGPLIRRLVAAGHEVTGTTRSKERAVRVRAAGGHAVLCDALDAGALHTAVAEAAPEAVVHELTSLPHRFKPRDKKLYHATNRLRREGTRNLLAAARTAGAGRFVCQSIAFAYAPIGGPIKDEDAPLFTDAHEPFGDGVRAVAEMERMVLDADGIVLRYGWFYGPGTFYGSGGSMTADVRRRRFPLVGDGGGISSFVHVDDAADATLVAIERGGAGIYNVVDDDPAPLREWLPLFAEANGARPPLRVPAWLARLVAGDFVAGMATALRGASNAKAKRELGWEPRWSSWRSGFVEAPR